MFLQSCKDLFQVNQSENYCRLYHQNLIISKRLDKIWNDRHTFELKQTGVSKNLFNIIESFLKF